jgi:hypothetical protein
VACRPGFFLPVRVLSRLFRRLFLEKLIAVHQAGHLKFFGDHAALADAQRRRFCLSRSADRARHPFERSPKRRSTHLGNTPPAPKSP